MIGAALRRGVLALALVAALADAAVAQDRPPGFVIPPREQIPNFREQSRAVILELAAYAKKRDPAFQVMMRGGVELLVKGEAEMRWDAVRDPSGAEAFRRLPEKAPLRPLVKLLDGLVLDDLYCGANALDKPLAEAVAARKELDARIEHERQMGIHRPPVPVELGPFSNDPAVELRRAAEIQAKLERIERQRRILYAVDAMRAEGRVLLSIESCPTAAAVGPAIRAAARDRVTAFAAIGDRLDSVPPGRPPFENAAPVAGLAGARNWLPVLRADRFGTKGRFVEAIAATNHDMVVVDVGYRGIDFLTKPDIAAMKFKKLGARRQVVAVMPIGRVYDWRWYWQKGWEVGSPAFLFAPAVSAGEPADGTFIADMASADWKALLGKYITGIMDLGFDGVMFDDVGTYLWFERLMPIEE